MQRIRLTLQLLIPFSLSLLLATTVFADLEEDIRDILQRSKLSDARTAISVRDADTDRALVSLNESEAMIPASNMKLLTAGTALHVLGPRFVFQTRLVRQDDRLIVIGDGDPGFGDPELLPLLKVGERQGVTIDEFLDLWIESIRTADIDSIREVVVDDRIFDREFIHDTWPRDQLNRRYCPEVSGVNFHLNLLHFYPRPINGASPDVSRFEPFAPWLDLSRNRATCRQGPNEGNTLGIARPFRTNNLTFFGNVRTTYASPVAVTVHDMPSFFAALLADRLKSIGVNIERSGSIEPEASESRGEVIAPIVRTPITTALTRCNRDSENVYAEALLKRAGHAATGETQPGSWRNGAAAVRLVVSERLDDPRLLQSLIVADGCGLSRDNRVSAALVTAWLNSFHRDAELGEIFLSSLAVAGEDGTLSKRFREARFEPVRVQAKSGYINQVSCLSGFVTASDGRRRTFSILINNFAPASLRNAKDFQEDVVAAIAEDLLEEVLVEVGG